MFTMGMDGTKWEIFLASVDLFSEKNFSLVSMRDIAGAVGLKATSIYNYYNSKDDMLKQIYDYFEKSMEYQMPSLKKLLEAVATEEPFDVLMKTVFSYTPEMVEDIMLKITFIAANLMNVDSRANELIHKHFLVTPRNYLSQILNKMIECGKVEEFDVDTFIEIYVNYCYSSAMRTYSKSPLDKSTWRKGVVYLFNTVPMK